MGDLQDLKSTTQKSTEKIFILRNSLLTDLFNESVNFRTFYYLFVGVFLQQVIFSAIRDHIENKPIDVGQTIIYLAFEKFHLALLFWIFMFLYSNIGYLGFYLWGNLRMSVLSKPKRLINFLDCTGVIFFLMYFLGYFYCPVKAVMTLDMKYASGVAVALEQMRLIMKTYAFIRTNVPKVLAVKEQEEYKCPVPKYKKFLYYSFAPTFLYRDEYPRSPKINWRNFFVNLIEFFGIIIFMSYIGECYFNDFFLPALTKGISIPLFIFLVVYNIFLGLCIKSAIFYMLLHNWSNLCAELTRFGDKYFYQDWWNSSSYRRYNRTWNTLVYEWTFEYLYKDLNYLIKNKSVSANLVVLISSIAHEYMIYLSLHFLMPVLSSLFYISTVIFFCLPNGKGKMWHLSLFLGYGVGAGIWNSMYFSEVYARHYFNYTGDNTSIFEYKFLNFFQTN